MNVKNKMKLWYLAVEMCEQILDMKNNNQDYSEELDNLHNLILYYPEIASIQNNEGENLGMICAQIGLEDAVVMALANAEAGTQQNNKGYNIGMIAAKNNLEDATLFAIENKEANLQQNIKGETIAMICAQQGFEQGVLKALNVAPQTALLSDKSGETLQSVSFQRGLSPVIHNKCINLTTSNLEDIEPTI